MNPEEANSATRFRFLGVDVDGSARQLVVDGIEGAVPQRVIDLLLLLCREPRQALSRESICERLWPGNQIISDESITQVIYRLRSALGPYAKAVVTVRGIGLRLDADVTPVSPADGPPAVEEAAPDDSADRMGPSPDSDKARQGPHGQRLRAASWKAIIGVLLVLVASMLWKYGPPAQWLHRESPIDAELGLFPENIHASNGETQALVSSALKADAVGNRGQALVQMEAAHAGDQRSPFPALMLSIWRANAGQMEQARRWLDLAKGRVAAVDDAYLRTVLRCAEASMQEDISASISCLGAMIALRPQASAFRLARARLLMQRGQRAAALDDLRQVEITNLGNRRMEMALMDRASLGDLAASQAVFAAIPEEPQNPAYFGVAGRLAYSAGDLHRARQEFARAARLGIDHNRFEWATQGQILAGVLAVAEGDVADAQVRLTDARQRLRDSSELLRAADVDLLLAELQFECGETTQAGTLVAESIALARPSGQWDSIAFADLIALRLGFPDSGSDIQPPAGSMEGRGVSEFRRARKAQAHGNRTAAARSLFEARVAGIFDTAFAAEAELLGRELGEPAADLKPVDPPSVPFAQFAGRWALAPSERRASGCKGG